MEPGREQGRRGAAAVCVLLLAFAATAAAADGPREGIGPGEPAGSEARAKNRLEIRNTSQRKILRKGRVAARLEVPAEVPIRTQARIKGSGKAAKSALISDRRERLATKGSNSISLPLNARGERRVRQCGAQRLIVQVRLRPGADGGRSDRKQRRIRATESLERDLERCGRGRPGAADFELDPSAEARHTNGTPRSYIAGALGTDAVIIAVFDCGNVDPGAEGRATFVGSDTAELGSPSAGIEAVEGTAQNGAPGQVGPLPTDDGSVEFSVRGADGCALPVVWADADGDAKLDIDSAGKPTESYAAGGSVGFEPQGVTLANVDRCDPLDTSDCLYPFPNDHFTVADPTTPTGRRINFNVQSMPANREGVPILPAEYNRADGFSPGSLLITRIDGIESEEALEQTGAVPIDDLGQWDDPDQPVVVIDAETGERHPVWAEIDSNPADPAERTLLIRPQRNFLEGHRYIVGLRNLKNAAGRPIEASRAFQLYRDSIMTSDPAVESRRAKMEDILDRLEAAGLERSELNLAWDFTIASAESIAGRMLSIRDEAFAGLGDTNLADMVVQGSSPTFSITSTEDFTEADNARIARRVEGTITVPCYMAIPACAPGGQYLLDPTSGDPIQIPGNTASVSFICNIPRVAFAASAEPARPSLYGHGLLGSAGEVDAGNVAALANEHNMIMCATDWAGFSTKDAASIALILQDVNNFPKLADGSQQGFLNFLFLGRALIHPSGLGTDPAFQNASGESLIDTSRLFYDGNSQGGILGGSLTAVAPDFDRAVLGVPGMNYSTLLRRSVDFDGYASGAIFGPDTPFGLYDNYPDELTRPLLLALIQMLWDRAEANGYAQHMTTDPLPNTPPHEVLLHVAFGDHQVANLTAEVQARTIGAATNAPLDPGRFPGADPLFDIPLIESYPYDGSAIVYFDSGSPNAPKQNVPPREGADPHGHPRNDPQARAQKSAFLQIDGKVIDVCGGGPCYANGYSGPGP
jgi:hypothetical protein